MKNSLSKFGLPKKKMFSKTYGDIDSKSDVHYNIVLKYSTVSLTGGEERLFVTIDFYRDFGKKPCKISKRFNRLTRIINKDFPKLLFSETFSISDKDCFHNFQRFLLRKYDVDRETSELLFKEEFNELEKKGKVDFSLPSTSYKKEKIKINGVNLGYFNRAGLKFFGKAKA